MSNAQQSLRHRISRTQAWLRGVHCTIVISCGLLALSGIVVLLAIADDAWELPVSLRKLLAWGAAGTILVVCLWRCVLVFRRWNLIAVAGRVEKSFPELGQRIRTVLEFPWDRDKPRRSSSIPNEPDPVEKCSSSGIAPSLISALSRQVEEQTATLDFQRVIPYRLLGIVGGVLMVTGLMIGVSAAMNWEWRTALSRAMGSDIPYTTILVQPGNVDLVQGDSLPIKFQLHGRRRDQSQLQWRSTGSENGWTIDTIESPENQPSPRTWSYNIQLPSVEGPLEYRIVAGPVASPVYHIGIRYPLHLKQVRATLQHPAYTGQADRSFSDGNMSGLIGSTAMFSMELDRSPATASIELSRIGDLEPGEKRHWTQAAQIDGAFVTWRLPLAHDLTWTLSARSPEGTTLPEKRFRVRVHPDRPPEVSFQEPDTNSEVHTLAEVLMQIHASDDFGLTRAGIVFQVNNLEEHTLLEEDFVQAANAAAEAQQTGHLTPRTRAQLERVLPLEYFELTQKDAVTYYAFAEDNFPGQPQRTRSDLRFIDIRPFRVEYDQRTGQSLRGDGGNARGRLPTALDELIRRERQILNRTMKLQDREKNRKPREINAIDELVQEQGLLAALTRELADYTLEFAAQEEIDTLYRAEASMLAAIDSLSLGNFETAAIQEKDAQQYLVEGRNQLRRLLQQSLFARQSYRRANSRLQSRLFRDRSDMQSAQGLVSRLRGLAREERELARMADGISDHPDMPMDSAVADKQQSRIVDLENRQYDVATDAHELLKLIKRFEDLNELVQSRMNAAAEQTDIAANSLGSGNFQAASMQARTAADKFEELAAHVETLSAAEFSQRVAATSLLTGELAQLERELIGVLSGGGKETVSSDQPELVSRLQRLRSRAETVSNLVQDLATFKDPNSGTGPENVSRLAEEQKVMETMRRISEASEKVEASPQAISSEVMSALEETRERSELTAAALDSLFRRLVTPRLARLKEFEARTLDMTRSMEQVQSPDEIGEWDRKLRELIFQLSTEKAAGKTREELARQLRENQLPTVRDWQQSDGKMTPPGPLGQSLARVTDELRKQILELILADFHHNHDEPVPAAYTRLVNSYLQILSTNP